MITSKGKKILAKYLVGQSPAYASYIAVGCGATPVASDGTLGDYSSYESLNFEMFRVPITSRGYVVENNVPKIVLTAQLPTEERYEITEIGVFSAGANPSAGANDSRTIYAFTQSENWEHHTETAATSIPVIYEPLGENNIIDQTDVVFQTNADNLIFTDETRQSRYERCRFLNNIVVMRGDTSAMSVGVDGHLSVDSGSHIHLNGISLPFNQNSPSDELRLAFTVVNTDGESNAVPDNVKILLEFASQDEFGTGEFARFEVNLDNGTSSGQHDFANNRYVVSSKQLQELYKSPGFSWSAVNIVKVYSSVTYQGSESDQFYVCLDALRLENIADSIRNPLYGLTGYSVIKNVDANTIIKRANTTNFIEFRFAMDVEV